ncbi:serpin family protein [Streptomyces tropicalis]|uniref:Serpin family protein n=1 Tax=Streptomyces tropicalis TaxID=3034234 RepID=A0ABT6A0B9_9ACTN|nr:serpin family protein [Streptomyces tropicalis]MDF3298092.1 serpin family protein [Streptomyces tropicalis]
MNALTARWAHAATGGTAFSAFGVWPLLAFLADGASGTTRAELSAALGLPADQAAGAARELLAAAEAADGLDAALGLWTRRTLQLREEWRAAVPAPSLGVLTGNPDADRETLDAWAAHRTGGLVERMPVALTGDAELVLASAFSLRTEWQRPFEEIRLRPDAGPWRGRSLRGLHRRTVRTDRAGVADTPAGPVTRLTVPGDNGIDVHLLLGAEHLAPGQVLEAGVALLGRPHLLTSGAALPLGPAGPGLSVEEVPCPTPQPPALDVTTVAYEVRADHDLLALERLFGLAAARDARRGHFPGISGAPLAVGAAGQSVVARFGALGFRAGAVTAVAARAGSAPPVPRCTSTVVRAVLDRPFGFLAVHRQTRLVLLAGWVADPAPATEPGGFGAATQPGGFGAATQPGGFGAATQPGGFGAATQPGGFGAGAWPAAGAG